MRVLFQEYTDGKSLRGAARSAGISPSTAVRWIKQMSKELPEIEDAYEQSIEEDKDQKKSFELVNFQKFDNRQILKIIFKHIFCHDTTI